jgi:hypothetical protein
LVGNAKAALMSRDTNFDDFSSTQALGEAVRHTQLLPQRWRELLVRLDELLTTEVSSTQGAHGATQPEQSEDDNGA